PVASAALRPGAVIVGYVPTIVQVKQLVDALRAHGGFGSVESFETLQRFWHVKGLSVRPEHRMVAHTGFTVVARVVMPSDTRSTNETPEDALDMDEPEIDRDR